MRYKTFRTLAIVGVVGVGAAGLYGLSRRGGSPESAAAPPAASAPAPLAVAAAEPAPIRAALAGPAQAEASSTSPDAFRPMDREILDRVSQGISGDKAKDAVRGRPWKVNLYKDAGRARVNRLKIDLDRDEKWDEKWTFTSEGGKDVVKRHVAPNDDEAYSLELRLEGESWRPR